MGTIYGDTGLIEQPSRREWSRKNGWSTIRTWEGARANIASKEDELVAAALNEDSPTSISTTEGELIDTISATFPDEDGGNVSYNDEDGAVWELVPMDMDKEIGVHGIFNPSASSPSVLEKIEEAIRRGTAGDTDFGATYGDANYNKYRDLRLMGVSNFYAFSFIIRKTYSTRKASQVQLAFSGVGQVTSYGGIGVPASAPWRQPSTHTYVAAGGGWQDVSLNEWMKRAPSCRWTGKTHEVSLEWWGAEGWSSTLYHGGGGIGASSI